jgi:hypothetical protein
LILTFLLLPTIAAFADQAKGTLTINTESPDVWFSVNVMGTSPPMATTLADAAGEHVATVAVTIGDCPAKVRADKRDIGLTGSTWCVHVSNLQAGYAVSGTIASPDTSLSLTVRRKDGPWFPLLWSVVALVAAAIISLLSRYVPGLTSKLRLHLYERDDGIEGLGSWVKTAAAQGLLADDDIVACAKWARKYGPEQVTAARGQLREALAEPSLAVPHDSKLWRDCEEESGRSANDVKREDVLTDRGGQRIKAENLLRSLTTADQAIHEFTSKVDAIIAALKDPDSKQQATDARDNALKIADGLTEDSVQQFLETLNDVFRTLNDPSRLTTFLVPSLVERNLFSSFAADAIWEPGTNLVVDRLARVARRTVAPVAVYLPAALLAFVIMAGAVATVFSAQYLANPSFGTLTDYWALILSAYGSAQATAIAAALLLMSSPKPSYG